VDVGASLVSESVVAALVPETARSVELNPETEVATPASVVMGADSALEGSAVAELMVRDSCEKELVEESAVVEGSSSATTDNEGPVKVELISIPEVDSDKYVVPEVTAAA
jgi:urease gamma subunit